MSVTAGATRARRDTRRFSRIAAAVLMPVGPLAVALLRFIIPFDPPAVAAAADPARLEVVMALGAVATFTLVPGAYAAVHLTRRYQPVLTVWVAALLIPGYLGLAGLAVVDGIAPAGVRRGVDPAAVTAIYDGVGELATVTVFFGVFLIGHILGTVLLGILSFRARLMPRAFALLFAVSQPLHLTAVMLANNWLDLLAWSLTAAGMAFLALRVLRTPDEEWDLPPLTGRTSERASHAVRS
ncbi:hypothetical protein [Microbacterium lushaniae]|uniref:DUF4386 family protein n=1 Tax=Microbacterium lushaniae TaxID=2614639 RepID=A0A5J6L535_9MICO|nr:hypothetical protein [Microbacterium lushaniae]QEW03486.1 hypothetical protein F6J85_10485 [Microbacterium lushaniae]